MEEKTFVVKNSFQIYGGKMFVVGNCFLAEAETSSLPFDKLTDECLPCHAQQLINLL